MGCQWRATVLASNKHRCFFWLELDGVAVGVGETSLARPVLTWTKAGLTPGEHLRLPQC